jgi:hypothetical protein
MKIEVGKKYRNGLGHERLIVHFDEVDKKWPYMDEVGIWYSKSGRICIEDRPRLDLIEEITE